MNRLSRVGLQALPLRPVGAQMVARRAMGAGHHAARKGPQPGEFGGFEPPHVAQWHKYTAEGFMVLAWLWLMYRFKQDGPALFVRGARGSTGDRPIHVPVPRASTIAHRCRAPTAGLAIPLGEPRRPVHRGLQVPAPPRLRRHRRVRAVGLVVPRKRNSHSCKRAHQRYSSASCANTART